LSTNSIVEAAPAAVPHSPVPEPFPRFSAASLLLLGCLLLLAVCVFHFSRNVVPGQITPDAMETIESLGTSPARAT
jgi:hypothetical protein